MCYLFRLSRQILRQMAHCILPCFPPDILRFFFACRRPLHIFKVSQPLQQYHIRFLLGILNVKSPGRKQPHRRDHHLASDPPPPFQFQRCPRIIVKTATQVHQICFFCQLLHSLFVKSPRLHIINLRRPHSVPVSYFDTGVRLIIPVIPVRCQHPKIIFFSQPVHKILNTSHRSTIFIARQISAHNNQNFFQLFFSTLPEIISPISLNSHLSLIISKYTPELS